MKHVADEQGHENNRCQENPYLFRYGFLACVHHCTVIPAINLFGELDPTGLACLGLIGFFAGKIDCIEFNAGSPIESKRPLQMPMPSRSTDKTPDKTINVRRVLADEKEVETARTMFGQSRNIVRRFLAGRANGQIVMGFIDQADGAVREFLPVLEIEFGPAKFFLLFGFEIEPAVIENGSFGIFQVFCRIGSLEKIHSPRIPFQAVFCRIGSLEIIRALV